MSSSDQENKKNPLPKSTQFVYTGDQRYISLKEELQVSPTQYEIVNSFILDPELSVIAKMAKGQIKLEEKIKKNNQDKIKYLIQNQKQFEQYIKIYNKHVEINNFLFGRQCKNRNFNSLLIHCDLISRVHTKIKVNAIDKQYQIEKLQKTLKKIVQQSHFSSNLRKLSYSLWQKIIQYLKSDSQYTIKDKGSRNGTFLINQSYHFAIIKHGQSYQFQKQQYLIKINQIIKQKGSILVHKIEQINSEFERLSFYRHQYIKKVIFCNDLNLQEIKQCQKQMHCIHFQMDFSENLKYFFVIIIQQDKEIALNIGSGQIININDKIERINYEITHDGKIVFQNNKWYLYPANKNGYIWTKLPSKIQYPLLKSNAYRFRLGHLNTISLKFHNFNK